MLQEPEPDHVPLLPIVSDGWADIMSMLQPLQAMPVTVDDMLKNVSAISQHVLRDEQDEDAP
eukprot:9831556-Lingulodinium_polyedra.AAC.1